MPTTALSNLIKALATGEVRLVDLTQLLSERTPVLILPEPFANTPGLSREPLSRYDDRGPAWAWDTLTIGEHVGTHFDAPIHWITGRDGEDVASVPLNRLVGQPSSSTSPPKPPPTTTTRSPSTTSAHSKPTTAPSPKEAGSSSAPAGTPEPTTNPPSSTPPTANPTRQDQTPNAHAGSPRRPRSSASA